MEEEQIIAQLNLFKSFIKNDDDKFDNNYMQGVYFTCKPSDLVYTKALELYGIDPEKWNQTFHKSFSTVRDSDIEILIAQQITHYFTTYGLEALNLYNTDTVYIPKEALEIPDLQEDLKIVVIKGITEEDLKVKLMNLLTCGIALSKETIDNIMILSDYINLYNIDKIKNKEVKIALYEKYNIVPSNNIEFLRYLIKKCTGRTLLIKDEVLIENLKRVSNLDLYNLLNKYIESNGYASLAQIFYRYKPLFLAMKRHDDTSSSKKLNYIINKIRKLAPKYHIHAAVNILDTLTQMTCVDYTDNKNKIEKALSEISLFRLTRLINSISYRLNKDNTSIVYKIRNGKSYVSNYKEAGTNLDNIHTLNIIKELLLKTYKDRLSKKLQDKTIYLPTNLNYAVPQSEKQFMGNIPEGSYIEVKRESDLLVGIQWTNLSDDESHYEGRVDLDLHSQNKNEQYGWNTSYRSNDSNFYFSGDVTDAPLPNGATEVFYIGKSCKDKAFLLTVNKYTGNDKDVPFNFVIAKTNASYIEKNFIIDPNDILVTIPNKFEFHSNISDNARQLTLGLIKITSDYIRFYFNDFSLGTSIITSQNKVTRGAYDYLNSYADTQLMLRELLTDCAVIVDKPVIEELVATDQTDEDGNILYKKVNKPVDYDLSLQNIAKDSLIEIFNDVN